MTEATTPPPALDMTKPPNFDALLEWVKKLQVWSQEAVSTMGDLKEELRAVKRQARDAEQTERNAKDELATVKEEGTDDFKALVAYVEDVRRGIRTGPELFDYMKGQGWMN